MAHLQEKLLCSLVKLQSKPLGVGLETVYVALLPFSFSVFMIILCLSVR